MTTHDGARRAKGSKTMIVRKTQIQAVLDDSHRAFVDRLIADLRRDFPATVKRLSDDLLRKRVEYAIGRARRWNLTAPRSIAAFVFLVFSVAPRFDDHRRVSGVLGHNPLPPNARTSFLLSDMSDADWDQVRGASRAREWPTDLRGTPS